MTEFKANIPEKILKLVDKNLHLRQNHPIKIIKDIIYKHFDLVLPGMTKHDQLNKFVSTQYNFDKILIPKDHVCRSFTDTYYSEPELVLRTQTSAHQAELLEKNHQRFLVTGDVYRKDEINHSHYPVFHQIEGVYLVDDNQDPETELKKVLNGLIETLFPGKTYQYKDDSFPFTNPSFEVNVKINDGEWLEILGCGVIQPKILENTGHLGKKGWAFGLGLERLAMILFEIPDIRYFWTENPKFLDQFKDGEITIFKEYSKLDEVNRDFSFFLPNDQVKDNRWIYQNDFYDLVRDIGMDYIAKLDHFDTFFHSKKKMMSHCYHILYNPMDAALNDPAEFKVIVDDLHQKIKYKTVEKLNIIAR
jgi:phenylalanyl-tRNA synthetase alpha chain